MLEEAINIIKEVRARPILRIYLNPYDWTEATSKMRVLSGLSNISLDRAFGIPVITSSTISRGMYILEYETMSGNQLIGLKVND